MPAAPHLDTTVLFRSPLIQIEDVRCRAACSQAGGEEWVTRPGFAIVRSGVFRKHLGRREVLADWNQAVVFNAGESYRISHPTDGGDHCTSFVFSDESLGALPFTHALLPPRGLLIDLRLRRLCQARTAEPLAVETLGLSLLQMVLASGHPSLGIRPRPQRSTTRHSHRAWADDARMYLASRFTEQLHLHHVAAAVGCSPFHLARIFRDEVGLPMHRYLTQLRLKAALRMLDEGCTDITRVGLDVGFSSHSHFTTSFRRATGIPPSAARRLSRGGPSRS